MHLQRNDNYNVMIYFFDYSKKNSYVVSKSDFNKTESVIINIADSLFPDYLCD